MQAGNEANRYEDSQRALADASPHSSNAQTSAVLEGRGHDLPESAITSHSMWMPKSNRSTPHSTQGGHTAYGSCCLQADGQRSRSGGQLPDASEGNMRLRRAAAAVASAHSSRKGTLQQRIYIQKSRVQRADDAAPAHVLEATGDEAL